MQTHREAAGSRWLERRVRAIVRDELAAAVDNSVDNPPPIVGGYRGGESNLENGGTPPASTPRFRKLKSGPSGQLAESELLRGYGLEPDELDP